MRSLPTLETTPISTTYYTLLRYTSQGYEIEFGSYDLDEVREERGAIRESEGLGIAALPIIKSGDTQAEIEAAARNPIRNHAA